MKRSLTRYTTTPKRDKIPRKKGRNLLESPAEAEKSHDAVAKFDTVRIKIYRASRSSPCDSTAVVML